MFCHVVPISQIFLMGFRGGLYVGGGRFRLSGHRAIDLGLASSTGGLSEKPRGSFAVRVCFQNFPGSLRLLSSACKRNLGKGMVAGLFLHSGPLLVANEV